MKLLLRKPRHYSVIDAAAYLELHPQTVYALINEDLIQHHRKGPRYGRIYFLKEDLDAYLQGNSNRRAKR